MQFKDLHTFWQSFSQHIADLNEFQETNESFFSGILLSGTSQVTQMMEGFVTAVGFT